jgi:hypothetical protein
MLPRGSSPLQRVDSKIKKGAVAPDLLIVVLSRFIVLGRFHVSDYSPNQPDRFSCATSPAVAILMHLTHLALGRRAAERVHGIPIKFNRSGGGTYHRPVAGGMNLQGKTLRTASRPSLVARLLLIQLVALSTVLRRRPLSETPQHLC